MAGIRYVGRAPDSDSSVTTKKWSDDTMALTAVTADFVNSEITNTASELALRAAAYIDQQDDLRAQKTTVDAADLNYVAATKKNAASGVAGLDSSGNLLSAQIPSGVVTDRLATSVTAAGAGILLAPGSTHTCTTTVAREFKLATVTVADPGYAWYPLPFATVTGWSSGTNPNARDKGTGVSGLLTCIPPSGTSDTIYGAGICAGTYLLPNTYQLLPYGASNITPLTQPALSGGLTLDLYGACFAGSGYVYSGDNLTFTVIVMPVMG